MNCYDRSVAIQLGNDAYAALHANRGCGSCGSCGGGCQPGCTNPCGGTSTVFISGTIINAGGTPVAGFPIDYTAGGVSAVTYTDAAGTYAIPVNSGSVVTLTPQAGVGVTVTPPSRSIGPVCADQPAQDFTISPLTPPGDVVLSGVLTGLPNVAGQTVAYTINGVPGTTTTDATGRYSIAAPRGSNVQINAPTVPGFTATPQSFPLTNVLSSSNALNFAFTPSSGNTFTFEGALTGLPVLGGLTVNYTINGVPGSTSTDIGGNYSITVPQGATIIVSAPQAPGFTATPPTRGATNVNQNMDSQDFAYTGDTLTISGRLTGAFPIGAGVEATVISQNGIISRQTVMVDGSGNYALAVQAGDTIILSPPANAATGVTPRDYVIARIATSLSGQNFAYAASSGPFTISGVVYNAQGLVSQASVLYSINNVPQNNVLTDANGRYQLTVPAGSNVDLELQVEPGQVPEPLGISLMNVNSDLHGQNFLLATQIPDFWPVSGRLAGLANPANQEVSALVNGTLQTVFTNQQGTYTFSVPTTPVL